MKSGRLRAFPGENLYEFLLYATSFDLGGQSKPKSAVSPGNGLTQPLFYFLSLDFTQPGVDDLAPPVAAPIELDMGLGQVETHAEIHDEVSDTLEGSIAVQCGSSHLFPHCALSLSLFALQIPFTIHIHQITIAVGCLIRFQIMK
jgi:hypothetical protein